MSGNLSLAARLSRGEPLKMATLFGGTDFLGDALSRGLADVGIPTRTAFINELEAPYLENGLENNPSLKGARSVRGSIAYLHRET